MASYNTLITTEQLEGIIGNVFVFDTRFDLTDPELGERAFKKAHIPGAQYLHLDHDLSGAKNGRNGRHPLPSPEVFENRLRALGLNYRQQVVVYDDQGGIFAARAWWLLRSLGHTEVAVLNGGLSAWLSAGKPIAGMTQEASLGTFIRRGSANTTIDYSELYNDITGQRLLTVVDARSPQRFAGQNETLDAKAGHIPGALNRFYMENLDSQGFFKPSSQLSQEFSDLLGSRPKSSIVHQCGSGVTACHNILAMEVAGLGAPRLYAGSWSEWSSLPGSPVEADG
ncbi:MULTISPECIES: sulfurtransferase [unclassified Pseudomonas]|uniref:sulfurtransferase n=1 Tax=unclassified Pseudomonas TaxID=196821 RepID=UPI0038016BA7